MKKNLRTTLDLSDLRMVMQEWLEAYDEGWSPHISVPVRRDKVAVQVRELVEKQ